MAEPPSVLTICGGGNGAHALAVLASANHNGDIFWLTSTPAKADGLRQGVLSPEGLRASGVLGGSAGRVRRVSSDPAEVIPAADMVLFVLPAFAHSVVLARIGPYLKGSVFLGAIPSRGGFEFEVMRTGLLRDGQERTVFGFQTLPWLCRVREWARVVEIKGVKARVPAAALPRGSTDDIARRMTRLLGTAITSLPNFLHLTLGNPSQIIHAGIMYAMFRGSALTYQAQEIPRIYDQVDEAAARLLEAVSEDIVAVARAIEEASGGALDMSGVIPIYQWLTQSYPTQVGDKETLASCFRTNEAYRGIMAPTREVRPGEYTIDFTHRFLSEDVPFGLVVTKAIAEIVAIPTPTLDEVVAWAQERLGKQYLVGERLIGSDVRELRIPQNHGIRTPKDLIRVYV